ncbi:hypothetical protein B484DRAFT_457873 [Ochromonadaceae sp. CCMP2298]|nr:hypothetical protein B484DRAFT_457873 [Ochromonadaceae sp. CCMP2298]|mmetsp:Transcript_19195/g.42728  ORF Transcript_19195/g.42728 Transcript_19195/m.42728 type:complete len:304 (-) Transcript_19195:373-1284(-)
MDRGCLCSILNSGHSKTVIEGPAVDECMRKLAAILEYETAAFALVLAWDILWKLTDHMINSSAHNLLSAIMADGALLSQIQSSAAKHLLLAEDETYHTVADSCLGYLSGFSGPDGHRQISLGRTPNLIKHLVAASVSFKTHGISTGIYGTLMNLLGRCILEDTHNGVVFFSVDGFTVMQTACMCQIRTWLDPVLAIGLRDCLEMRTVGRTFAILGSICCAYTRVKADLPPDLLVDCEIVLALAEHVHKALSRSLFPELIKTVVPCVVNAFAFLLSAPVEPSVRVATMEKFLLYSASVSRGWSG